MGWRFRQSFKVIPGLRLNLSKSGLSASIGGAPLTLNIGPHGLMGTASIPGTGISYRQHFGISPHPQSPEPLPGSPPGSGPNATPYLVPPATPVRPQPIAVSAAPIEEIRSASTELLTSESLKELKKLMQMTFEEHEDICRQLDSARPEQLLAWQRFNSWNNGFLFKRLFKRTFANRKVESEIAAAKVAELEEQLRLTTIATHVEIEKDQADPYFKMRDDFAGLSECAAIWDVKSYQATDKFHERTTANRRVDRKRVTFTLDSCDLIQWEQKVPHLQNCKGGDLYLYPGFILYRAAKEAFSVIDYHDVTGKAGAVSFQEEECVPADSKVIGQTWAKANKDGSRDRRFAGNYQIPIAQYGCVTFKSASGLWEEFQFSNPERLIRFLNSFNAFVASFGSGAAAAKAN
jgi:hypothetical protein